MSKIALSGPASGTATYTISAPTGATDRTITLPDQTATLITNSSGVLDIGSGQLYKDASGNLGIGTSSPTSASGYGALSLNGSTGGLLSLKVGGTDTGYVLANASEFAFKGTTNAPATFYTNNTERMRIDTSGNLLVGTTSVSSTAGRAIILSTGAANETFVAINHDASASSGGYFMGFRYNGTFIGNIAQNGTTATSYNTSSDYRLKHDIAPMTGALAKLELLKPCTYKWNADGSDGEGFIAHELAEVCPGAVTGAKDAVDADGNPQYQGIDTSFLVATLTAAIQEQQAIITALTARVTALEGTQP